MANANKFLFNRMSDSDNNDAVCENQEKEENGSVEKKPTPFDNMSLEERKAKTIELKNDGNQHFKQGEYEMAIKFYTESLQACPEDDTETRAILYSNLAASRDHLGEYEEAINLCSEALTLNDKHVKALLRRANLYKNTDKLDEALEDYEKYLQLVPDDFKIRQTIPGLKAAINERNEKLKAEMLSKLKSLGNVVLKPFGLSTDNFQMVKNEETGGYSVNFHNNNN